MLVDVDPEYLLIDPDRVAEAVTERTQAIVPVHLFGQVAPVEKLIPIAESVGAVVVEDAAQSQGATRNGRYAGSLGVAAGTSFYPGKNLGAAGDAGAVTTNDPEIAARVRLLGAHGSAKKYIHDVVGVNSRLDTVQAVVLSAKLKRLAAWNERRRRRRRPLRANCSATSAQRPVPSLQQPGNETSGTCTSSGWPSGTAFWPN